MADTQPAGQSPKPWSERVKGLLRLRDFRLMWAAGGLDNTGRWMDVVVMGLLVLELTDSAFQVALLFVFRWVPMLAFALISGMVADRANRWAIMMVSRMVAVTTTGAVLVLVLADAVEPWHVFIASFFLGGLFVLEFPSRRSLIYDLVGSDRIVSAMSLETINSTLGRFMGPFLAGLLIELTDFSGTYIVLMVVYIVAFVLILVMKGRGPVRAPSPYAFWSTVSRGFKYSLNNSVIRSVLLITLIMNAMAFSVESLFPVVAKNHLGVGPGLTGILISAQAIGSLAAASVIASLAVIRYHGRIFALGLVLQLISLLFFALSPWYPVSFLMLMLAGLGAAGYSTMQSTIILISSEPEMRGTALGMLGQCIGVAAVGGLAVGVVANYFSAQAAVAMSVSLGLLLLIPVLSFSPLLRRPISPPAESAEPT
ncbi:MAG: MFS transporter [Dehalococcoidia bacterium]|uniref:Major facilitator superfamily (MFS) profile domain-containing protein n=1 Tax=marine metagenome TaxID=408172 RepID=A0A381NTI5_9ZZZZ|nr:MFS transporter [Dehalococcoidia bacterium]MEC9238161.1 MFS transporter [Chloroflexota bacterium]MEE3168208.1 MFS transporter [Chloroflexota bacterium]